MQIEILQNEKQFLYKIHKHKLYIYYTLNINNNQNQMSCITYTIRYQGLHNNLMNKSGRFNNQNMSNNCLNMLYKWNPNRILVSKFNNLLLSCIFCMDKDITNNNYGLNSILRGNLCIYNYNLCNNGKEECMEYMKYNSTHNHHNRMYINLVILCMFYMMKNKGNIIQHCCMLWLHNQCNPNYYMQDNLMSILKYSLNFTRTLILITIISIHTFITIPISA